MVSAVTALVAVVSLFAPCVLQHLAGVDWWELLLLAFRPVEVQKARHDAEEKSSSTPACHGSDSG